jgi:EAL domain-containing protein (putative c-di-GMP-specific phosphodiesterase class I)
VRAAPRRTWRGLNLPVAAEGVDTHEQLDFLTQEACSEIQRYLIGRPKPIEAYCDAIGRPSSARELKQAG